MNSESNFPYLYQERDVDSDLSAFEIPSDFEGEEDHSNWKHLNSQDIGSFYFDSSSVDQRLCDSAILEANEICSNARRVLGKSGDDTVHLSEVANYFLAAIIPGNIQEQFKVNMLIYFKRACSCVEYWTRYFAKNNSI
jgi:hypothetical protein